MKLIVGLGNPGNEYEHTRHNVGFTILDQYCQNVDWKEKFHGYVYKTTISNQDVIFLKPITFMNLSGVSVQEVVHFYHIDLQDILVIQDDLDLPLGTYKLKRNSSSGGHNGIKSIIQNLHSEVFLRLKIGIATNHQDDVVDYVLGKFSLEDYHLLMSNFDVYKNIITTFIENGIDKTFAIYSKK